MYMFRGVEYFCVSMFNLFWIYSRGNAEEITRTFHEKRDMYRKIVTEVKQCRSFIQVPDIQNW